MPQEATGEVVSCFSSCCAYIKELTNSKQNWNSLKKTRFILR